jgi:hypothetical protein
MYSKVYWIGCDDGKADDFLAYYEANIVTAVQGSEHHLGHHLVHAGDNRWLLVANYHDADAAEAAAPMVQELVKPMMESFGMTMEVITAGEVTHQF